MADRKQIGERLLAHARASGSKSSTLSPDEELAIVTAASKALDHWWHGGAEAIALLEHRATGRVEVVLFIEPGLWPHWEKRAAAVAVAVDLLMPAGREFILVAEQI